MENPNLTGVLMAEVLADMSNLYVKITDVKLKSNHVMRNEPVYVIPGIMITNIEADDIEVADYLDTVIAQVDKDYSPDAIDNFGEFSKEFNYVQNGRNKTGVVHLQVDPIKYPHESDQANELLVDILAAVSAYVGKVLSRTLVYNLTTLKFEYFNMVNNIVRAAHHDIMREKGISILGRKDKTMIVFNNIYAYPELVQYAFVNPQKGK